MSCDHDVSPEMIPSDIMDLIFLWPFYVSQPAGPNILLSPVGTVRSFC